jgi:hypothetical protein
MTLPHEAEVISDIAAKYRTELDAMTGLHNAVMSVLSAGSWTVGKSGIDGIVLETMVGLLTKACKTFRSIQILCERGLIDDADALVRMLMENTVAILFILQKRPRERARIYQAHSIAQGIKMLNEWKNTPGLKRKATKNLVRRANEGPVLWTKNLPAGTDVKHHWSGKRNLQETVKALRGDAMYATLYRFTSSIAHASDFGAHVEFEPASGDRVWQIEPRSQGLEASSNAARELLWNAANRIDQRIGLGFSASLAPHKIKKPK